MPWATFAKPLKLEKYLDFGAFLSHLSRAAKEISGLGNSVVKQWHETSKRNGLEHQQPTTSLTPNLSFWFLLSRAWVIPGSCPIQLPVSQQLSFRQRSTGLVCSCSMKWNSIFGWNAAAVIEVAPSTIPFFECILDSTSHVIFALPTEEVHTPLSEMSPNREQLPYALCRQNSPTSWEKALRNKMGHRKSAD